MGVTDLTAKPCESCKSLPSTIFCRADSAFLCVNCDAKIHAANKLASRHARVPVCQVCEQSPASVTCRADTAALCVTCDHDIHSANPLARRHDRHPIEPFYDAKKTEECYSSEEDEVEAASWLLTDPKNTNNNNISNNDDVFSNDNNEMGSYLDLMGGEKKVHVVGFSSDGVVPVQDGSGKCFGPVVDGYPTYEVEYHQGTKPLMYNFTSQSISQSVSSSSLEVGVVPDHNTMADVSNNFVKSEIAPTPLSGLDREAKVLRYREKRKNRKFEKTIRYASRKAYAETRPRIKGRFAKRGELEVESLFSTDASYGVVPTS